MLTRIQRVAKENIFSNLRNENSYHLMMLGLCQSMKGVYNIISNRENR